MKALITGGCGFIGSFISRYLLEKGIEVIIITRNQQKCWRIFDKKSFRFYEGNLMDREFVEQVFRQNNPDIIIHAAWDGVVGKERDNHRQIGNLVALENLLEISSKNKIRLFIGLGSQAEYGVHNVRIDEGFSQKPDSLYGLYKLTAGLLGKHYAQKHGFNYAWLRLFSTFGPKDYDDYILPYTMNTFLKGESPRLTECSQKWDYLYVKDIARLIWKIIETEKHFCDIYNFCSGEVVVLKDVILTIRDILNLPIEPSFGSIPFKKNGLFHLEGENKKFRSTFGWIELTDIKKGLDETVKWFKEEKSINH